MGNGEQFGKEAPQPPVAGRLEGSETFAIAAVRSGIGNGIGQDEGADSSEDGEAGRCAGLSGQYHPPASATVVAYSACSSAATKLVDPTLNPRHLRLDPVAILNTLPPKTN